MIFPQYEAGTAALLEPTPEARAFMGVAENSFNYSVLGGARFTALAWLVDRGASPAYLQRTGRSDRAVCRAGGGRAAASAGLEESGPDGRVQFAPVGSAAPER